MSIDKNLLYKFIIEGLDKKNWENIPDRDLCDFLIRLFVFNVPIDNAIFETSPNMWLDLPNDKTLITNDDDKGLPIGDLTSQLFGNVYLNNLDQYIKHTLKIKYYGRYVDDMVLISNDKEKLLKSIEYIRKFLEDKLLLKLHPNKIQLQHAKLGFNFIGARIYPFHVSPTKRIINNYKKLEEIKDYTKYVKKQSYLGIFKYMNGCEKFKTL